ncbi:MAG: hypothetical protein ACP5GJ_04400 [Nanopusillaceae archaeon]|jgi:hypothetical protein
MTEKQSNLLRIFERARKEKVAIGLFGGYGIGKSSLIYQYSLMKSMESGRELKIWHELTEREKKEILENPEKYFIVVDIKGSLISLDNLVIPIPVNDGIKWEVPLWMKVLENEKSMGILFIDEVNMTLPSLQSLLFELVFQRKLGESTIKGDVLIITAGNDLESNNVAKELPQPLINRMIFINANEIFDIDAWLEYAKNVNIDNRIIGWVLFNNRNISYSNDVMKQSTTPRSLEMLSKMINGEKDMNYIRMVAYGLLEPNDALQFTAFIELYEKFSDIDKYIDNIELLYDLKEDERIIIMMKITERYINDKLTLEKYYNILDGLSNISKMLVVFSLRYLKYQNSDKFKILLDKVIKENGKVYNLLGQMLEFENKL